MRRLLVLNKIFPNECNFLPDIIGKYFLLLFNKALGEQYFWKGIAFFCVEIRMGLIEVYVKVKIRFKSLKYKSKYNLPNDNQLIDASNNYLQS